MTIYIEKNLKYGDGYQLRMVDTNDYGQETEDIIDFSPYTVSGASMMIRKMLEIYNRKNNTNLTARDCVKYNNVIPVDFEKGIIGGGEERS